MPLGYVDADLCEQRPEAYKVCSVGVCVNLDAKCPCERNVEYRCGNGDCIPLRYKCDGIKHCKNGEDEMRCSGQRLMALQPEPQPGAVSTPLLIVLVSLSIILCVLICLVVIVYVTKRRKNNTSRESQSVTVPLKKKFVVEVSDVYDKSDSNTQIADTDSYHDNKYKEKSQEKLNDSRTSLDSQEYKLFEKLKNSQNKYWGNLGLPHRNNEIYALEHENNGPKRTQKRGKYMFKPRLKSLEQEASINPDDIRLNVALNSYRHFSGKISLPVTFDPEPETFASDLLCASTPRQIRHLVKEGGSESENTSAKVINSTDLVVKQCSGRDEVL